MEDSHADLLLYRRCNFSTRLPRQYRYTRRHEWIASRGRGRWRVGLTRFGVRMLGEMVEQAFDVPMGGRVAAGDPVGWLEGFKAISDLCCPVEGRFLGGNPALRDQITLVNRDPYGRGWLYEVAGRLDPAWLDVEGYRRLLDRTIDRLRAQRSPDSGE